jgi:hypothetical protein
MECGYILLVVVVFGGFLLLQMEACGFPIFVICPFASYI